MVLRQLFYLQVMVGIINNQLLDLQTLVPKKQLQQWSVHSTSSPASQPKEPTPTVAQIFMTTVNGNLELTSNLYTPKTYKQTMECSDYEVKNLGQPEYVIGIHINYNEQTRTILLNQ